MSKFSNIIKITSLLGIMTFGLFACGSQEDVNTDDNDNLETIQQEESEKETSGSDSNDLFYLIKLGMEKSELMELLEITKDDFTESGEDEKVVYDFEELDATASISLVEDKVDRKTIIYYSQDEQAKDDIFEKFKLDYQLGEEEANILETTLDDGRESVTYNWDKASLTTTETEEGNYTISFHYR